MLRNIFANLFTFRPWQAPIITWVSYLGAIYALYLLLTQVSPFWLISTVIGIFCIQMGVTVGLHRLFCHQSFDCGRIWKIVLAYWATIGFYGSTIQWSALHITHHRYSDTEHDPMQTHWVYLLWNQNRNNNLDRRVLVRLSKDPLHKFFHNFYLLIIATTVTIFYAIDSNLLLYGYVVPLAWYHLVNSLHTVFAHWNGHPRNWDLLELIFFTGGEWGHLAHHQNPKSIQFGQYDLGYHFIGMIKT